MLLKGPEKKGITRKRLSHDFGRSVEVQDEYLVQNIAGGTLKVLPYEDLHGYWWEYDHPILRKTTAYAENLDDLISHVYDALFTQFNSILTEVQKNQAELRMLRSCSKGKQ